jgi:16S rRNA (guanine966-N2)-methyltransferase
MRVISGHHRGRKLFGPRGQETRPTGDRLKETLFNIIGDKVDHRVFLDVFAGTGAIGLEAVSRGAGEVVFIERDKAAVRLIRRNLETCGVASGYRILEQDVFAALRMLARQGFHADMVFLDPPYEWEPYQDLLDILFTQKIAGESSLVVVEHHRKAGLPESRNSYARVRIVRQGDHCLSFYRLSAVSHQESAASTP